MGRAEGTLEYIRGGSGSCGARGGKAGSADARRRSGSKMGKEGGHIDPHTTVLVSVGCPRLGGDPRTKWPPKKRLHLQLGGGILLASSIGGENRVREEREPSRWALFSLFDGVMKPLLRRIRRE